MTHHHPEPGSARPQLEEAMPSIHNNQTTRSVPALAARIVAILGILAAIVLGSASPATSAGTISIAPNPVPFTTNQTTAVVQVNWTGQKPSTLLFVSICFKSIADPTFRSDLDCSALSVITPNGTATGAGSKNFNVFRGQDPSEEPWGCFAAGDTPPAGVEKYTTCFVRITNNVISNNDDDVETAFTLSVGGDIVPEAPLSILIPIIGAVVVAGAFFLLRRRSTAAI